MHYYQFHIGDYRAATAHLSNDEDLAYRRLLDLYYDTEKPIAFDLDWLSRRLRLGQDVIKNVLRDMFVESDDGWVHHRCDSEIAKYHSKAESARKANQKRWGSDKDLKSDADQILTNNQEPITNKKKAPKVATPEGVSDSLWSDYLAVRKSKKAELTETAMEGIRREAANAGKTLSEALTICCERGWVGFNAKWLDKDVVAPTAAPDWLKSRTA